MRAGCLHGADEIKVLERIYKKFKHFESAGISEYSHKDTGYFETKKGMS